MADQSKAFDLNNPPKSVSGGVSGFQEYPKHLHHADGSIYEATSALDETQHVAACPRCAPKPKDKKA